MKHINQYLDEMIDEFFNERAAIIQHDAKVPKEEAEKLAKVEADKYRAKLQRDIDITGQA